MALVEIMGSRRETKTGSRITHVRKWECLKTEITNTSGYSWIGSGITLPAKGDALGYGTWTNKVEPRLYDLQIVPHRTRKKTYVVGYYGAPMCQGSTTGTRIEITDSQNHSVRDTGFWSGYRKWSTPDADIITNRASVMTASWTVNGIALLPKRTSVAPDLACPGTSIITAHFDSAESPYNFTVNRVRLSVKTEMSWAEARKITAGWINGGEPTDLDKGKFWKPIQGSDQIPIPKTLVWLKTAYTRPLTWSSSMGLVGKTNSGTLSNILGAAAGELLCLACDVPETFLVDTNNSVVPVIYTLAYKKDGWNKDFNANVLKVAQFQRMPKQRYVLHPSDAGGTTRKWLKSDGTAADGTVEATRDVQPDSTTDAVTRVTLEDTKLVGTEASRTIFANDGDFSALNTNVYWGG